ncbi:MAG: hypothetical protein SGBAC_001799 [Bacillariaceae sp.]
MSPKPNEPRQSRKSKEEREAKDKVRAERKGVSAIDHTGAVESIEAGNKHRTGRRRGKQNRDSKDAVAKAKNLMNGSNEPNTGPMPGAHADSRGAKAAKEKNAGKETYTSRPLGTQSVFPHEAPVGDEGNADELVTANTLEGDNGELTMELLNLVLEQKDDAGGGDNQMKKLHKPDASRKQKTEQNGESNGRDGERLKQKKKVRICQCLLCMVVIIGAGIGTWLGLAGSNSSMSTSDPSVGEGVPITIENITDVPPTQDPNVPPTSSSVPSASPTTNIGVGFDPPTAEDCAAMTNGEPVQGQDAMLVQRYQLELDATPFLPMDPTVSAGFIEDKLRELLAPALTGCNLIIRHLRHHRRLDGDFTYAIGNVIVNAAGVQGVECLDSSNPLCHRVSVVLEILVKDDSVKVVDVIGELSTFFAVGDLAEKLQLAGLYETFAIANLGSIDPTPSPSKSNASAAPSAGPTIVPASQSVYPHSLP